MELEVWYVLVAIVLWVAVGMLALWWMARQGYRDPRWILMAAVLGPIFAAVVSERSEREPRTVSTTSGRHENSSRLRVLVGLDGSAASDRALETVLKTVGADRARLLLVRVVGFDRAESTADEDTAAIAEIEAALAGEAERIGGDAVESVVAAGAPARTILKIAEERDVDLIAIGRHGSGLSKALMGDVAQHVTRDATVPVLIGGSAPPVP